MEQALSLLCIALLHSQNPASSTAAMMSYCPPLQLHHTLLFDCDCECALGKPLAHDPGSDPGYVSAGSSLSPTSSLDSFCFSPASLQGKIEQDVLDSFLFSSPAEPQTRPCSTSAATSTSAARKSRSRYPGKKRQTASEREKLRMRDLTKALHHLRTYLPPSVAPAGQTLTKIETLRLTIRYISHLSAQLGLSEEALEQRTCSGFAEQLLAQPADGYTPQESSCDAVQEEQPSSLQDSYQASSVCPSGEQYWMHQQQPQTFTFSC